MTAKKLSNGAVKNFRVGDRVVWDKAANAVYEVVKLEGEKATIKQIEHHPSAKRRVSLNELKPLDIGSNKRQHAKSSRGLLAKRERIKDRPSFSTLETIKSLAAWGVYQDKSEKCSYNLTSVAALARDSRLLDLSPEALNSLDYANGMNTAATSSLKGLRSKSSLTLRTVTGNAGNESKISISTLSLLHPPVSPSVFKENGKEPPTSGTVSAQSLERSEFFSPNSSPLKTSQDSFPVPTSLAIPLGHISAIFSGHYSRAGTMHNGFVSVADTLERPSLENGYCWLESPNALSSTGKGRPPGQSRLEAQLKKLGVLENREVLNPQFLEKTYNLPLDWTNPQELRAATELLEQDALHSATALTPELQVSPSAAFSTLTPSVNNYSPLVLGEANSYASVFPLKLKQERNLVLGDSENNSFPPELEPTTKRKASGWLERYTKNKKLKSGVIATYPRVEGEREPNNSEHWYWAYRWEEKRDTAKSDNGYVTRAVSLPKNKVEAVQLAITRKWSQEKILNFIRE